jgi:hypothetical protein
MPFKIVVRILFIVLFLQSCEGQNKKINGISFVASREKATQKNITPVLSINANFAAVMPFGFIRDLETPEIIHNTDRQWFGETRAGAKQYIELLHKNNIEVMVKPQIWIRRGEFTGYLKMNTEENWQALEKSYSSFILEYASLAAEVDVAIFCIGTELEQFIVNRPTYWKNLIAEIKKVYKGKLTYAANWDEYKRVPFWGQLDYIGVDAYFPISESKTPTVQESQEGWKKWKTELKGVSQKVDKPIVFTEYGYRSVDFSGKEPWVSDHTMRDVNLDAQKNLMQALFNELYKEDWFKGGFIWKWFIDHERVGGNDNPMFTPQNKPVEEVIKKQFLSSQ